MNLVEITGLKGRDRELIEGYNALNQNQHILIMAPDGYGKTAIRGCLKLLSTEPGILVYFDRIM